MTEIVFYHLQRQPLERVLPQLLEKTIDRHWKAIVRCNSAERLAALDDILWTFKDTSFLPHGTHMDVNGANQPIYLTLLHERPNNADILFLVDGAILDDEIVEYCIKTSDNENDTKPYTRIILIFDGNDETALQEARKSWKAVAAQKLQATYWQQDDQDRWVKKA